MSYLLILNDKGRCTGHGLAVVGGGCTCPGGIILRRISKFGLKSTLRNLHSCYSVVRQRIFSLNFADYKIFEDLIVSL